MRYTAVVLLFAACGGAGANAPPPPTAQPEEPAAAVGDPDAYAALSAFFKRKRPLVSQCYAQAMESGEIKGTEAGYVTVGLVVKPTGKADRVHVAGTSLRAPAVEDCIVKMVKNWVMPAPAKALDFKFAYEFRP